MKSGSQEKTGRQWLFAGWYTVHVNNQRYSTHKTCMLWLWGKWLSLASCFSSTSTSISWLCTQFCSRYILKRYYQLSNFLSVSYSYNGGLTESHTWFIEPRLFQWPWRTPNVQIKQSFLAVMSWPVNTRTLHDHNMYDFAWFYYELVASYRYENHTYGSCDHTCLDGDVHDWVRSDTVAASDVMAVSHKVPLDNSICCACQ